MIIKKSEIPIDLRHRPDYDFIVDLVKKGRVLDLGCGNGDLLYQLKRKGIKVQGIEKDETCIYNCIEKGIYVYHGDIDDGLTHHIDKSFDFVILNQTLQETINPGIIIKESLRIGKKVIIVFPNFAHWEIRWQFLFSGKTPVTELMPHRWSETPNLHFITIKDFYEYCADEKITISASAFFSDNRKVSFCANYRARLALFVIQ